MSAGTYQCTQCGNQIDVGSTQSLPPCPECANGAWNTISGGDAADDPQG
ncbi:MAG: zinc ribbon-containing protein [Actinomycetota bacterium]|nr:zinc ribbon-containing protein [Actinomycetota bacterium]